MIVSEFNSLVLSHIPAHAAIPVQLRTVSEIGGWRQIGDVAVTGIEEREGHAVLTVGGKGDSPAVSALVLESEMISFPDEMDVLLIKENEEGLSGAYAEIGIANDGWETTVIAYRHAA